MSGGITQGAGRPETLIFPMRPQVIKGERRQRRWTEALVLRAVGKCETTTAVEGLKEIMREP
jgi:hypothetical protein